MKSTPAALCHSLVFLYPARTVSHGLFVLLLMLDFSDFPPVSTGDQNDAENGSPLHLNLGVLFLRIA